MSGQVQPTTEQLVAAFVASLAPLAGPYGIAISGVTTALMSFYDSLKVQQAAGTHYLMADALDSQGEAAAALQKLIADRAIQKASEGAAAKPAKPGG